METYAAQCIRTITGINQHTENARQAYKKHLYERTDAQLAKAQSKLESIVNHPEHLDDDLTSLLELRDAFALLNIPLLCRHSIIYSNKVLVRPLYQNFASALFYIKDVSSLYQERVYQIRRVLGKKLESVSDGVRAHC